MAAQTERWLYDRQIGAPTPPAQLRESSELVALRARCEALERRCEALDQALRGAPAERLQLVAPRRERVMLDLLMRQPLMAVDQGLAALEAEAPTEDGRPPDAVHIAVTHLRRRLRPYGVGIRCTRFVGYWIDPADKVKLREALRP
jgi:hypothetical protein